MTADMDTEMTIVKTRGGFAVRQPGLPYYLFGPGTKRAAQEYIDRCLQTRAELAAFEAARQARIAELLAAQGIGVIDYRQVRPGDSITTRPEGPARTVTEARHLDSGAALIFYEVNAVDRACGDFGHVLLTHGFPVYGVLRTLTEEGLTHD